MSCSSLRSRVVPSVRRIVLGGAIALTALGVSSTVPATAGEFVPGSVDSVDSLASVAPPTIDQRRAGTLDGFTIDHLPDGLGTPSDFKYEWEDVSFRSRVWETGPDADGAFRVDLTMKTLRGEKLTDLAALKAFLLAYQEEDPESWDLTEVKIGGYDGLFAGDEVFYFVSPGVAAEVTVDHDRFTDQDVLDTAAGFRPEPATS